MCNRTVLDPFQIARKVAWGMATPLLLPILVPLAVLDLVKPEIRLPPPFDM